MTLLVILDLSAAFDTVRHGYLAGSFEVKTWRDRPGTHLIYILLSYRTQLFAVNAWRTVRYLSAPERGVARVLPWPASVQSIHQPAIPESGSTFAKRAPRYQAAGS